VPNNIFNTHKGAVSIAYLKAFDHTTADWQTRRSRGRHTACMASIDRAGKATLCPYGEGGAVCRARIPSRLWSVWQQTSAVSSANPFGFLATARTPSSHGPDAGPAADRRRVLQQMAAAQSPARGRVRLQRPSRRLDRRFAAPVGRASGGEQHRSSRAGRGGAPSPDQRQRRRAVTVQQKARRLSVHGDRGEMAAVRVLAWHCEHASETEVLHRNAGCGGIAVEYSSASCDCCRLQPQLQTGCCLSEPLACGSKAAWQQVG